MMNKIVKILEGVIMWGGLIASICAAILLGSFALYLAMYLIATIF